MAILALTSSLAFAACDQPAGPAPAPGSAFDRAGAPLALKAPVALAGGDVVVYGFEDAPLDCNPGGMLPNPYQDLVFLSDPYFGACDDGLGNVFLIPSSDPLGDLQEVQIQLPGAVESASISVYSYDPGGYFPDPILTAYDADGNVLATASDDIPGDWFVLTVSASEIERLGITTPQQVVLLDDLTLVYPSNDGPATKDDCKKGGWQAFGFKNQGQCVRFVETGKDSR